MKFVSRKYIICYLAIFGISFSSCIRKKEAINTAHDAINSPIGYWVTEGSQLGQVGWEIGDNNFKKCTILLGGKITEETGSAQIDGNRVKYTFNGKNEEYTATYHSDNNTLVEDQLLKLTYMRGDDSKMSELNRKGCHFGE